MARDGALPQALAQVAPGGSPRLALTLTMAGAVVLAASGAYLALVAINAPLRILIEIALIATVVRLRRTAPDMPRPFRMPLYPMPVVLGLIGNTLLLIGVTLEDPANSGIAIAATAAAALFIWWRR
jgi:APA family basic amino acid/polyamine antiporter